MSIPVGLNVWSRLVDTLFPYLDQVAAPFDTLWFPDHVQYGDAAVAEGWSAMMFALARYPGKVCGHEVLCNSFRNPAHLAKMAATAQVMSNGRFVMGIGAGWNEEEYRAYGWPYPSAKVRIEQLAESIQLMRLLWRKSPATFHGQHYTIENAYCEPRPNPMPPVMVGGAGEQRTLRVVAEHADLWNYPFTSTAEWQHKQAVLKRHCDDVKRDYAEIKQVIRVGILIAESEDELRRLQTQPFVRKLDANGIAGTPQQVLDALSQIVQGGAAQLNVHFADAPRPEGTQLFAERVLPALRQK
jgi:alkanesulfonate monooxygenase SsuD/methylene tetrahydromethanopterin reductase-like flavin-dependent oxidoreductase (luciferase family)